jgi:hypothetical protein
MPALRAAQGPLRDFDLSVANYNQTLIGALNDVATQVASIRAVDRQMDDAQRALDASTRAYDLAVIRYKAGLSPQLQVLNADSNRLASEQTVTNLKMRRRDMQRADQGARRRLRRNRHAARGARRRTTENANKAGRQLIRRHHYADTRNNGRRKSP